MADCLKNIDAANKGRLNDDEIETIVTDLQRARDNLDAVETDILRQGKVIAEQAQLAASIAERNAIINVIKETELWNAIEAADRMVGDPSLGLEAALVGVNAPFEGSLRSVDTLARGYMSRYMGGLVHDMKSAGLLDAFRSMRGEFSRDVSRALYQLNAGKVDKNLQINKDAQAIAEIMHKYQRAALERENRAGAYISDKRGYVVRQSHQPARMVRAGFDKWAKDTAPRVDWDKMGIPPAERAAYLKDSYDALITGVRFETQKTDIALAFKGPGNLAKKESQSRVIEFKTADDWFEYDALYGRADLRESFLQDLQGAAKATALMTRLGTNPQAMVDRITQRMLEAHRSDSGKVKRIKREGVNAVNIQHALDEVTGDVNIGSHTRVARVSAGYRALQTMSKLGGAAVSAISDVAFVAANRKFQGRSMMEAWGDALTAGMSGLKKGQERDFADLLGAGLEGMLGDFMSRVNAADDVPGRTSKMMSTFFKLNLLGPWTDAHKRGVTMMLSRDLAMNATKAMDDLPADFQRMLKTYGLDARQWEIARQAVRKAEDGREYIMPGDVADVRGSLFTGMSEAQQTRLRDEVQENLFAMLSGEADFAAPTPGARERAIMRRGTTPGSAVGEAVRFVMMFKSFSVTSMSKIMGRHVYGSGSRTIKEQLGKGMSANMGLVNAIAGTTVMGFFVMQLKELMKGREMRPLDTNSFIAAMMQGGGLGLYGDFIFGEANRYGGSLAESLAGPGLTTIFDAVELLQKARGIATGDDGTLGGDTLRLIKSNVPFANLFYAKGALDYLLWYQFQEMLNPGYLRRMERRVERENNQQYWLPPSSVVATGGGFR